MNRKNSAPVLAWAIDRDGKVNYVSAGWLEHTGKTYKQTLKDGWLEDIHPDDREVMNDLMKTRTGDAREYPAIFRLRQAGGGYSPAAGLIHPHFHSSGDFDGWSGSAVLTSEDKAAQAVFSLVSKNMREIVCLISADTRILYISPAVETILGYPQDEVTGQLLSDIFDSLEKNPEFQNYFSNSSGEEVPVYYEICLPKKSGEMVWLEMDVQFLRNDAGVLHNVQVVARDVTSRKQNEEILRLQNEVSAALWEKADLKDSLEEVLKIVLTFEGFDCGGIYVVDSQTGQLDLMSHIGLGQSFIDIVGSYTPDHPLAKLARSGIPIYGKLSEILGVLDPVEKEIYSQEGLLGFAAIPITYQRELIALFNLASHNAEVIPSHSRQIIELIARQIGALFSRNRAETALRESEGKFRGFFEQSTDIMSLVDEKGVIVEWNPASEALTGLKKSEVVGRSSVDVQFDLLPPEKKTSLMYRKMQQRYASIVRNGDASCFNHILEGQILDKKAKRHSFQQVIFPIRTAKGVMLGSTGRDVTQLKQIEKAEQEQRRLTEALIVSASTLNSSLKLDNIIDNIFNLIAKVVPSDGGSLMFFNADTGRVHGIRAFGTQENILNAHKDYDEISIQNIPVFRYLVENSKPLIIHDTDINPIWKQHHKKYGMRSFLGVPICTQQKVIGILNLQSAEIDHFQQKHAEWLQAFANQAALAIENSRLFARVEQLAVLDELTHVYNRRGLKEIGDREVERAQRFGHQLAVLFLDVDHFKEINDEYSHAIGDEVLRAVASCFGEQLRSVDMIGRYGGEEFVFLLPETGLENARVIAERLRLEIERMTITTVQGDLKVTASIGVSSLTGDIHTLEALLDKADAAVHRAKAAGRNRVKVG
jgi:diguanylate cyclase (GGDEF)-like protein/PAS domain S-box-containing protein